MRCVSRGAALDQSSSGPISGAWNCPRTHIPRNFKYGQNFEEGSASFPSAFGIGSLVVFLLAMALALIPMMSP
jgi:hypothetical protein